MLDIFIEVRKSIADIVIFTSIHLPNVTYLTYILKESSSFRELNLSCITSDLLCS